MILLLLRNNHISLHQSSNFVWSPLNYPRSETILFGITAYILSFIIAGAGTGTIDISLSDCLYASSEALFVIFKDPNLSDNASILFVLCKLSHVFCSLFQQ